MNRIRIAEPADDDLIALLLIRSFSHLYASMGVDMSPIREAYLKDQKGRRAFATSFICEVDGLPVGTVTLVPPSSRSVAWISGAWELRLLAVDPERRGLGNARKLIGFAEQHAQAAGAAAVCLHARRGVPNQARLYIACDYVRAPAGDLDTEPFQEGYWKRL